MPAPSNLARGAMFDVRPVDKTGKVDFDRIALAQADLDLRKKDSKYEEEISVTVQKNVADPFDALFVSVAQLGGEIKSRDVIIHEIQQSLEQDFDLAALASNRAKPAHQLKLRPRPMRPLRDSEDTHHRRIISAMRERGQSPVAQIMPVDRQEAVLAIAEPKTTVRNIGASEMETLQVQAWYQAPSAYVAQASATRPQRRGSFQRVRQWPVRTRVMVATVLVASMAAVGALGLGIKGKVSDQGALAVENLQDAQNNLQRFDFAAASEDFENAYEAFTRAGDQLNVFGANVSSVFANLPGGEKFTSANNLIETGKLLASAGHAMTNVAGLVSQSGLLLNPKSNNGVLAAQLFTPLRSALKLATENLGKAKALLVVVDPSVLPEEQRPLLTQFSDKLPEFEELLTSGSEFAAFFEQVVSPHGSKHYVLLFQNNSELRPTGGFPGTYGIIALQNGRVNEFFAQDIYDIDGQLKELIVPPSELQHITPTWGMRDANWFVDFPTSAKKILSFYKKETGQDADGIITINPTVMTELLKIIGPIELPEYELTITADNFLNEIQNEVEYGPNKAVNQPKKIVADLAPMVLDRLASLEHAKWADVLGVFMDAITRKDTVMYFKDAALQRFAVEKNLAGQVKQTGGDYLMVTLSNVKGAKTDAVTDTVLAMDTTLNTTTARHMLTISRRHNGGTSPYGFYNRINPAYVRVLVPQGARLVSIAGNAKPNYAPIVHYAKSDFIYDPDLTAFESTSEQDDEKGVTVYKESGKTEFGFWLIVEPGKTQTVKLEYEVALPSSGNRYELYVQKQPGLGVKNFQFTLSGLQGQTIDQSSVTLSQGQDGYVYLGALDRDLPIEIVFRK